MKLSGSIAMNCPSCQFSIPVHIFRYAESVVCPRCKAQILLTEPDAKVIGQVNGWIEPLLTAFQIGMVGTINGTSLEVVGRVRYRDSPTFSYDEWLLLDEKENYYWLLDDQTEGMVLWRPICRGQQNDSIKLQKGKLIKLCNHTVQIVEYGRANVAYLEGVYTWSLAIGDALQYVNGLDGNNTLFSQDYTDEAFECYRGQRLKREEVALAFGARVSGGQT